MSVAIASYRTPLTCDECGCFRSKHDSTCSQWSEPVLGFRCHCATSGAGATCPFSTDDRAEMIAHYREVHCWTTSVLPGEARVTA